MKYILEKNAGLATADCAVASTSDTYVAVSHAEQATQQVNHTAQLTRQSAH